jgi:hypothetical protein
MTLKRLHFCFDYPAAIDNISRMEKECKRIGRPPIDPRKRRCRPIYALLSAEEVEWLDRQAEAQGVSRYRFLRDRVLEGMSA